MTTPYQRNVRSKLIKASQDRPIPIESNGPEDSEFDSILNQLRSSIEVIKSPDVKQSLNQLADSISIVRNKKSYIDATRENIEILWNRVNKLTEGENNYTGSSSYSTTLSQLSESVTPSSPTFIDDNYAYMYDDSGNREITAVDSDFVYDTEMFDDNSYDHTQGSSEVTLKEGGNFEIDADFGFDLNAGDIIEVKLQVDSGAGYNDVEGTRTYISGKNNQQIFSTASVIEAGGINLGEMAYATDTYQLIVRATDSSYRRMAGIDANNIFTGINSFSNTVSFSSLTASRLLSLNGSNEIISVSTLTSWIAGTSNQITVTDDLDGTITLSLPQDIHTSATPTFAGLTVNGNASITGNITLGGSIGGNGLGLNFDGEIAEFSSGLHNDFGWGTVYTGLGNDVLWWNLNNTTTSAFISNAGTGIGLRVLSNIGNILSLEDTNQNVQFSVSNTGGVSLIGNMSENGIGGLSFSGANASFSGTVGFNAGTQNYLVTNRSTALAIQGQNTGAGVNLELYPFDANGTDNVSFRVFAVGDLNVTNTEYMNVGYSQSNTNFEIATQANGTGILRNLVLYTEGNTDQFVVRSDGDLSIGGNIITGTNSIGGAGTGLSFSGTDATLIGDLLLNTSAATLTVQSLNNNAVALVGNSDRTSAGVSLLDVNAQWNSTTRAQIRFLSGSDNVNKDEGRINFRTAASGGTLTNVLTMDENQLSTFAGNIATGTNSIGGAGTGLSFNGANATFAGTISSGQLTVTSTASECLILQSTSNAILSLKSDTNNNDTSVSMIRYYSNGAGSASWSSGYDPASGEYRIDSGALIGPSTPDFAFTPTGDFSALGDITAVGNLIGAALSTGNETFTYDEGSFSGTATDISGTPSVTISYVVIGKIVQLFFPDFSGTSTGVSFTITGLPAAITPSNRQDFSVGSYSDNGSDVESVVGQIHAASNEIRFFVWNGTSYGQHWTSSGTKGFSAFTVSYSLY